MANDYDKKVLEYKERVKLQAEELVLKTFPKKIIQLDDFLKTEEFSCENLKNVHSKLNVPVPDPVLVNSHDEQPTGKKRKMDCNVADEVPGTKVFLLPSGPVPCNRKICDMMSVVKPFIRTLVEDTNCLKMWISFLIPKIEDGNNFGVSIQEDTLTEIRTVESEAATFFDQISRYFITRGKIVSKVAKYPHIDDYRRTVNELDEKEYVSLRLVMAEIRNHYSTLHDIITKNIEKIKKPRSCNVDNLY